MTKIIVIAHDIRSTHNVGALLRTADCLGASKVYLTGYTPYPSVSNDARLPHTQRKLTTQIHKTALGAENLIDWEHLDSIYDLIADVKKRGFLVAALEQAADSIDISRWTPSCKVAVLLGREVEGIAEDIRALCDITLEIPQYGKKESLNVVQAAAIAIYHIKGSGFCVNVL